MSCDHCHSRLTRACALSWHTRLARHPDPAQLSIRLRRVPPASESATTKLTLCAGVVAAGPTTSRSRPAQTAVTPLLRLASTTGARRPSDARPPVPAVPLTCGTSTAASRTASRLALPRAPVVLRTTKSIPMLRFRSPGLERAGMAKEPRI
ncbi:60S ribosomal protein L37 (Eurofung) [Aspergillus nidulans FGSC A4]|uniref:60S ribosomal protein L37 (Eurofung) n=1 Tax=Emericella nidulans (strain FGSC A4 / ATCC 38163 / CBS 112.46 / NRRL 194 / M139) TaxID=227321 RepID=UPI0001B78243|nr:hypothetical protein [Aspergillus nidulans FGSC A4]CBF76782.1 TPA: 60S ribosomal protein L37 (Eurofung) [Aspergillus nidulans FGSC A4]